MLVNPLFTHLAVRASALLILLMLLEAAAWAVETMGAGDRYIHVIPSLSSPSVKNGQKLKIQAVIKASAGVAKVEARIIPMEAEAPTNGFESYCEDIVDPLAKFLRPHGLLATLVLKSSSPNLGDIVART